MLLHAFFAPALRYERTMNRVYVVVVHSKFLLVYLGLSTYVDCCSGGNKPSFTMAEAIEGKENLHVEKSTVRNGDPLDNVKLLSGTKRRANDGPESESSPPQDGYELPEETMDDGDDEGSLIAKDNGLSSQNEEGDAENAASEDQILSKEEVEDVAADQIADGAERKAQASAEESLEKEDRMDDDVGQVIEETNASKIDIHRPVKRARSAYFIFIDDKRAEVQKQVSQWVVSNKEQGNLESVTHCHFY